MWILITNLIAHPTLLIMVTEHLIDFLETYIYSTILLEGCAMMDLAVAGWCNNSLAMVATQADGLLHSTLAILSSESLTMGVYT